MNQPIIPNPGDTMKATWARDLIEWIRNDVMPKGDGKTTKINGNIVTALLDSEVKEYSGPFCVKLNSSGTTVRVSWPDAERLVTLGLNVVPSCAGYFWINQYRVKMQTVSEFTASAGFLCIKATLPASSDPVCDSLEIVADFPSPTYNSNYAYYPLALIYQFNSKWNVIQLHRYSIPQLWIYGPCD